MEIKPTENDAEEFPPMAPLPADPGVETFFSGAYSRIRKISVTLTVTALIGVWITAGAGKAATFAVGAAAGLLNFIWLEHSVRRVVDRLVGTGKPGAWRYVGYLLRYVAVLGVGYATLNGSKDRVLVFCAGLFVPILAAICEGAYETYIVYRRSW